jgi:protein-export membrane protein SecD
MNKYRIGSLVLILALFGLGFFIRTSQDPNSRFPFKFGLDLVGGTELIYRADVSQVGSGEIGESMETLREVIERRVNIFGVSEPIIQVEEAGIVSGNPDHRLIVELPGVTDIDKAVALIGETPLLEFRLQKDGLGDLTEAEVASSSIDDLFTSTGITGRLLSRATLQFDPTTNEPVVALEFNSEGTELFAQVTRENVGKVLAIFLDGQPLSLPVVQTEISDGYAVISGQFDALEARDLVRNLNYGALPLPIELISTETVGATLGEAALDAGVKAGVIGFLLTVIFLVLWYRLPGLVASVALVLYIAISMSIFKLIPVTLTAAGLAGFILSIGMAVDANILIFERMKEELRAGKNLNDAIHEGFKRAWLSIRDSNVSSIITAIVLFWLGTSAVKGFALTLGLGVIISMFTAITASRTFLFAIGITKDSSITRFLYGSGIHR